MTIRHEGGAAAAAIGAAALVWLVLPGSAFADACTDGGNPPGCELQVQWPVDYGYWKSKTYAYYCRGDHPFWWGWTDGYDPWERDNSCFTVTPGYSEDDIPPPDKFQALITNWCLKNEDLTITLGCSNVAPPVAPGCNPVGNLRGDPGCPVTDSHNSCNSGLPPVCIQSAVETCSDGTMYQCTYILGIPTCYQCSG